MLALYVVALLMMMIAQGDANSLDTEGYAAAQMLVNGKTDAFLHAITENPQLITWIEPNSKRTLLYVAAAKGNFDMAKVLIEHGADVNAIDNLGYGPIHPACLRELSFVQLLVENGVDPKLPAYHKHTPLIPAVRKGSTEKIGYLMEMGFSADSVSVRTGEAPLHLAVKLKLPEKIVALLEAGAYINIRDKYGNTAAKLLAAQESEDQTMLHTLLFDYCPDLTIPNDSGKTALDTAMEKGLEANALLIQEKLNNTCSFEDVYYPLDGFSYQDCMEYVCLPNCTWNATGNEDPSCTETDAPDTTDANIPTDAAAVPVFGETDAPDTTDANIPMADAAAVPVFDETDAPDTADANIPMADAAAVPVFAAPQRNVLVMVNQKVDLGDGCDSC